MDPHNATARVLFRLLRDNVPVGVVEQAIEHVRLVQKEVPDSALGRLACEMAERIEAVRAEDARPLVD